MHDACMMIWKCFVDASSKGRRRIKMELIFTVRASIID